MLFVLQVHFYFELSNKEFESSSELYEYRYYQYRVRYCSELESTGTLVLVFSVQGSSDDLQHNQ